MLAEKEAVIAELQTKFSQATASFVVQYQGCTCAELTGLRRKLGQSGSRIAVVKNTLAKRAIAGTSAEVLSKHFRGPTAVVWSGKDPVSPAKALKEFSKGNEKFLLRAGLVEGSVIDAAGVEALAQIPSREELLSKLLALINAPATRLLQTMNAPASNLVRLLAAWKDKKEKE